MTKATHKKTTVDVIKQQKRNIKRISGQARQQASGVSAAASSTTSLSPSSQSSSAGNNTSGTLRTVGDTMIGPIAFWRGADLYYPTSGNNNTLDVSSSGAYSSHWIWAAAGSGVLEIISGAAFGGQILFVEGTATTTQTIKDRSNTSGGNTGNILTLDGNDVVLTNSPNAQIILLIYSDVTGKWQQVSNTSAGGSSLLSSNNTWTGTNTFSGGTFTSSATTSTSITSPSIFIGDSSSDALTITATPTISGNITSSGVNTWTGVNTFQANVSFTGATTTIGDANTDLCTIYAKMGTDVNMGTYDINTLDRLLFDVNGSDAIGSSDYGIGAEAAGGSTVGLIYSTPASKTHKFNIGGTPELTISNSYISAATKRITNVTDPSGAQDAATKAYVDANSGGSSLLSSSNNWSANNTFNGVFETTTTTKLGNGSNDAIEIYGKTDYKNNHSTITLGVAPLPTGYITIKISGTQKRLYYYAG